MISKIVYPDGRTYICDGCKKEIAKFKNYDAARKAGWAVSWERINCFCPKCAPKYRRGAAKKILPTALPKNEGQISIDNL